MPRFIFQLEGVLRHRRDVEHHRQRDLAMVQAQMVPLEAQLAALDAQVRTSNADVRQNRLTGRIDLNFLAAHRRHLVATQRQAMEIAEKMALVQRKIDRARQALIDAARDRAVLEKLRERQQAAWQAEVDRKELAALDEVTMQMTYRKQRA
jgi:flagellar FliJ protein